MDRTALWERERRVLSIDVDDREGEISDSCTIELDDRAPHIAWPPEGTRLNLWLGASQDELVDMGTYSLDAPHAHFPPHRLTVRGHAATFVAKGDVLPVHEQRMRAWTAISLGDMLNTIAQDHGLLPRIQPALSGILLDPCRQTLEDDLSFLKRIAARYDAKVRIKGAKGHPGGALEIVGGGPQLPQVVLTPRDVESGSVPFGSKLKAGSVTAFWHNPKTGASGSKTAGHAKPHLYSNETFETAASAASHARSRLKETERHHAELSIGLTRLDTSIASGTPVALSGFRPEIDGIWNVTQARHRADSSRARTSLVAEKAA